MYFTKVKLYSVEVNGRGTLRNGNSQFFYTGTGDQLIQRENSHIKSNEVYSQLSWLEYHKFSIWRYRYGQTAGIKITGCEWPILYEFVKIIQDLEWVTTGTVERNCTIHHMYGQFTQAAILRLQIIMQICVVLGWVCYPALRNWKLRYQISSYW